MNPALIEKLKAVDKDSILGVTIHKALKEKRYDELEKMLCECWTDNQHGLNQLLGFNLQTYLSC